MKKTGSKIGKIVLKLLAIILYGACAVFIIGVIIGVVWMAYQYLRYYVGGY